jgi:hypothetical protein
MSCWGNPLYHSSLLFRYQFGPSLLIPVFTHFRCRRITFCSKLYLSLFFHKKFLYLSIHTEIYQDAWCRSSPPSCGRQTGLCSVPVHYQCHQCPRVYQRFVLSIYPHGIYTILTCYRNLVHQPAVCLPSDLSPNLSQLV